MNTRKIFGFLTCIIFICTFAFLTDVNAADEPEVCHVTMTFKEATDSGASINSGNGVATSYSNTISLNGSWSKFSRALGTTEFEQGGSVYKVMGWYDEDGSPVPASMYYNGDSNRIKVTVNCTEAKDYNLTYTLKWKEEKAPILLFNYTDRVSTGSGSWTNSDGSTADYSHKFKEPASVAHYKFLYWAIGDDKYNDGDIYTYSFEGKEPNTTETVNAYAWWQSSVTLNLYDGNDLLSSEEDFEKVTNNSTPTKPGYNFVGWEDENGNPVTETEFYPYEKSSDKIEPKVINLYAKWERITTNITINKTWNDNNNSKNLRPNSISVNLYGNGELFGTYNLTNDMNWTYTLSTYKYLEDGTLIDYYIDEVMVKFYITKIDGFNIVNELMNDDNVVEEKEKAENLVNKTSKKTKTSNEFENPNTSDNISIFLITAVLTGLSITGGIIYLKRENV